MNTINIPDSAIGSGQPDQLLSDQSVHEIVEDALAPLDVAGKKVLLIVPDSTRTAPVGLMFKSIYEQIGHKTKALDVIIALGTHQPMSEDAINTRLEVSAQERKERYG